MESQVTEENTRELLRRYRELKNIPTVDLDFVPGNGLESRVRRGKNWEIFYRKLGEAQKRLHRDGYIPVNDVSFKIRNILVDPFSVENPASEIMFYTGLGQARGSAYHSATDFFGKAAFARGYLVTDNQKYSRGMSKLLDAIFRKNNPRPDHGMKNAFTHFMHTNGFHWSGCRALSN